MATSAQALQELQNYQGQMKGATDLISGARGALGVGAAQEQVKGLRGAIQQTTNLLNRVAPGVMGRTGGSLVTSAQANKIIQNEQAPIQGALQKNTQAYGDASQDYQNLESQAQAQAQAELQSQQNKLSYLQNIYQNVFEQEKEAARQREAERAFNESMRQFNASLAAQRAAAAAKSSGGLNIGGLLGALGGGSGAQAAPTGATKADAQAIIKAARQALGGGTQNWGKVAGYIEKNILGSKIPTGSYIDQVLRGIYG